MAVSKKKLNTINNIVFILAWYIVAKLSKHSDEVVFDFLGVWSRDTIKHLVSAINHVYILKLIVAWEEKLISTNN